MEQLHRRLTDKQVRLIFMNCYEGQLTRVEIQATLGVGKSHFFVLLKIYRQDPVGFSVGYQRHTPGKMTTEAESTIREELKREKKLVEDKELPILSYNYSVLHDRLKGKGIEVSLPTIIKRAKEEEAYQPKRKGKIYDREVVTTAIGALIQHDASTHLWSPFAKEKWTLITFIDVYSHKLLYTDFVSQESS
jgi:hypothetical protein